MITKQELTIDRFESYERIPNEELLETARQSKECVGWLRFALASAGMIAWQMDLTTGIVECSQGAGLLGPMASTTTPFCEFIHPSDRSLRKAAIERAIQGHLPYDLEFRLVLPDGVIWVSDKARLTKASKGHPTRLVGVCTDITASKHREEQLNEDDRHKNEFMAILGHELRNPLAPMSNAIQILDIDNVSAPAMKHVKEMLGRQVQLLTRLVEDLQDYSRITHGKIHLRKELVVLSDLVAQAVETCQPLADLRRHELLVSMPHEPIRFEADGMRIRQVLVNLINNAVKYMHPDGTITVIVEQERGQAVIRVRDTGEGITAKLLPRVFEMFNQVDGSLKDSQGGLGIGLALVQCVVQLHGGTVEAFSDGPGRGSEFVVRLPCLSQEGMGYRYRLPS